MNKLVKDTLHVTNSSKVSHDEVEQAIHWIKNSVIDEASFNIRPQILHKRTYDQYTTSNVESDHSIIKSKGVGVLGNTRVTSMFEKTDLNAKKKCTQRLIYQTNDLMCTNVDTKCHVSKLFVKPCYMSMVTMIQSSKSCIQTS